MIPVWNCFVVIPLYVIKATQAYYAVCRKIFSPWNTIPITLILYSLKPYFPTEKENCLAKNKNHMSLRIWQKNLTWRHKYSIANICSCKNGITLKVCQIKNINKKLFVEKFFLMMSAEIIKNGFSLKYADIIIFCKYYFFEKLNCTIRNLTKFCCKCS